MCVCKIFKKGYQIKIQICDFLLDKTVYNDMQKGNKTLNIDIEKQGDVCVCEFFKY